MSDTFTSQPAVQAVEKDAQAAVKVAAGTVATALDSALDGVVAASPQIEADGLSAVEQVLEAFVNPAIRPFVQAALGMLPAGTALAAISAEEKQLVALAKLRIAAIL